MFEAANNTCPCRVCVVYGALPPEMRRTQARLFNDPDSGYDVLVASDAVGMGLNLNIRRIIFHTLTKFENGHRVPSPSPRSSRSEVQSCPHLPLSMCIVLIRNPSGALPDA